MKVEFEKESQDIQRKYVWTVKGTKIEDIYIWYDNNDLSSKYSSPIPSDKLNCHYITNRMLKRKIGEVNSFGYYRVHDLKERYEIRRRERMHVAGMRKRKRRRKNVQSKTK